jgi:hypothetical protein
LIVAERHLDRGRISIDSFMEAVADAEIMIAQARIMYQNAGSYRQIKTNKLDRLTQRMQQACMVAQYSTPRGAG